MRKIDLRFVIGWKANDLIRSYKAWVTFQHFSFTDTETIYGFELASAVCPLIIRFVLAAAHLGTRSSFVQWHRPFSALHRHVFSKCLYIYTFRSGSVSSNPSLHCGKHWRPRSIVAVSGSINGQSQLPFSKLLSNDRRHPARNF